MERVTNVAAARRLDLLGQAWRCSRIRWTRRGRIVGCWLGWLLNRRVVRRMVGLDRRNFRLAWRFEGSLTIYDPHPLVEDIHEIIKICPPPMLFVELGIFLPEIRREMRNAVVEDLRDEVSFFQFGFLTNP